jgi:hypothetical protein
MSHYLVRLNEVITLGVPALDVKYFDIAAERLRGEVSAWRLKALREQFLGAIQRGDFKYVSD